jgi:hypothetical protein
VPRLSLTVTDFLPVKPTPVITLLTPGPVRWKSWLDENYLSTAIRKLEARNRAEALLIAEEKGWL